MKGGDPGFGGYLVDGVRFKERIAKMNMSGFVVTKLGDAVLQLSGAHGVRYAGSFADGKGIAAFDAPEWSDVVTLSTLGDVYMETSEPEYPDTWPDWARPTRGPKRKIANGTERFALISPVKSALETLHEVAAWEHTMGACIVHREFVHQVLIECNMAYLPPFEMDWYTGLLRSYRDVREMATA